ncbi:hypothetical protein [Sphingomonas oligophenolica]|uniref:Uncharacterized protein n=1 Tax=Sphingomonas oligophenolica TaxID=301154 RepID=A0A502CLU4_9SPHN|nr:hypothetical protein [Sphingomonas oligophenolica]TPG12671.1 hypothetical protein EAH84_07775 [Sphingomonas oligophenolica]
MMLFALLALAQPAALSSAQVEKKTGHTMPRPPSNLPENFETKTVAIDRIADCLIKHASKDATKFLQTPLLSGDEQVKGRHLLSAHASCFGRAFLFATPVPVLRGALAERRLASTSGALDSFARRTPAQFGRVPSIDGRPFLVGYAGCLAVTQPGWTSAFLRAPRESATERRQFMQFGDSLKACMPVDATYHVDIPALRDEMAAVVELMIAHGDGA